MSNNDYQLAERLSQKLAARSPHLAAPHNNLSLIYALQGHLDKAIDAAGKVLEQHPDNLHALAIWCSFSCERAA